MDLCYAVATLFFTSDDYVYVADVECQVMFSLVTLYCFMYNIALVTFLGLQNWSASMINIYEHRKTCIFCALSLVKPTKVSWNFLKIWSWNLTSCCWEPCGQPSLFYIITWWLVKRGYKDLADLRTQQTLADSGGNPAMPPFAVLGVCSPLVGTESVKNRWDKPHKSQFLHFIRHVKAKMLLASGGTKAFPAPRWRHSPQYLGSGSLSCSPPWMKSWIRQWHT